MGKIKTTGLRLVARGGNYLISAASALTRRSRQELAQRYPQSFIPRPEEVETQTMHRIGPTLQHVVKKVIGKELPLRQITDVIRTGHETGLFHNYGEAVFINPYRIDDLLLLLKIPAKKREDFITEARQHYLLHEYFYAEQARGIFGIQYRTLPGRGTYIEREYSILTRDGKILNLTRIINQAKVQTNDNNPSVLFIPGIACNHGVFDLDDEHSLVLEHADQKCWVYSFDPRGLGKNKGEFDHQCFFDTLVSNDLPAAVDFIHNRPSLNHSNSKKPVVLIGHSMGGMIAEFMLVRQAYKLNQLILAIAQMSGNRTFRPKGKTRKALEDYINQIEAQLGGRSADKEIKALIAEARLHLGILKGVKGLITLGSPKIFDKNTHPIYPALLMLNLIFPIFRQEEVPVDKAKWLFKLFPSLTVSISHFVNPDNFEDPKSFLADFVKKGTDSFPLGVGFQLLKSIYSGKGVCRLNRDKFNYSAHLDEIPPDIPIFHFIGDGDSLAPDFNLAFIDHDYYQGKALDFSGFPPYLHQHLAIHSLDQNTNPDEFDLKPRASQVQGFVIKGVNHLDYLYGKTAKNTVRPLLTRLVRLIWESK